jgi:hypothetical protein
VALQQQTYFSSDQQNSNVSWHQNSGISLNESLMFVCEPVSLMFVCEHIISGSSAALALFMHMSSSPGTAGVIVLTY